MSGPNAEGGWHSFHEQSITANERAWVEFLRIISRGAGLIAGSPTGRGNPGRVTVPTPSPA